MPTPTGQISMSDVNIELNKSSTSTINMGDSNVRTLARVGFSGPIDMNSLRGRGVFEPDGGPSSSNRVLLTDTGQMNASVTINCMAVAQWSWTKTGSTKASPSGTSGSFNGESLTFSIFTEFSGETAPSETATYTVEAAHGAFGLVEYWTVTVSAFGTA